jgi:phosphoglycerate dehydrogenase-like enzyme
VTQLGAWLPGDVLPDKAPVPIVSSLPDVGFYVPRYMGPVADLELMASMPHLQVVQLLTAGYDNAMPFLPAGVILCNAAGVHDSSTAELAIGLMLASLRGIDDFARAMPEGAWASSRRPALADRRVVVVGAGGVGQAIARRLAPFETEVVMVGSTARSGVTGVHDLPDVLPSADVVVLALPLTDATRRMVDDAFLSRMKDGALLVNVARGGVVDTDALVVHAASGRIRAAVDVTDPEPLPPEHPLWRVPGVLISPHVGGNSSAFLPRARRLVSEQLTRWVAGEPLRHVVWP